jgi:hypothetical protein
MIPSGGGRPGETVLERVHDEAHPIAHPELMKGRKLFVVGRKDANADGSRRLDRIREQFEKAPDPKQLVILESSAHAQFLFATDQGPRLMSEILRFLQGP